MYFCEYDDLVPCIYMCQISVQYMELLYIQSVPEHEV